MMKKKHPKNQANFENDHLLLKKAIASKNYKHLLKLIKRCTHIFLLGNGGLMDISSHAAADLSRLVPGKSFRAFNDAGFLTSNANDWGFENSFTKWLQTTVDGIEIPATTLILGLSCSGNSANIVSSLGWSKEKGFLTFLIDGVKSTKLPKGIGELTFGCKYFHTNEVLTMKLVYDIVHKLGHHCPTIAAEAKRKSQPEKKIQMFDSLGSMTLSPVLTKMNRSGFKLKNVR